MKKNLYIVGIIVFIVINSFSLYTIINTHDKYKVIFNGENKITISYGDDFNDPLFKLIKNEEEEEINKAEYDITSDLDSYKLGEYKVNYYIKYHNKEYTFERIINVVDDIAPEIITDMDYVSVGYCDSKIVDNLEYKVLDNYDGDITKKAKIEDKNNKYIITAVDSNNNKSTKELTKKVSDKPDNKIKLNGNSTIYVVVNGKYEEQGAVATDGCGNPLDDEIEISGKVDTTKEGKYNITYKIKGSNITATRIVRVYTPSKGSNINDKVIYLTFDDGPGAYTSEVLDILAKYNIKATFFVTNQFNSYVNLIEREYKEGHSIGVHSLTHKWDVYDSLDTYINDFNKMNDIIEKYTGQRSKIFRFPGGASNTISKGHSQGVVTEIANRMLADGYQYFDWNVDSGDAAGKSSDQIYNNVVNGVGGSCTNCVVLMHDIHKTTVNQLDKLLATLTSQGYKFDTLDVNSPTCHHRIAN